MAEIADTVGTDLISCESGVFKNQRVDSMTIATLDVANLLTHLDNADSNHQLVVVDARKPASSWPCGGAAQDDRRFIVDRPRRRRETHAVLADLDAGGSSLYPHPQGSRARPTRSPTPCRPVWPSSTPSTRPDALVHCPQVSTTTPRMLPHLTQNWTARTLFDRYLEPVPER